jgi:hypothetical protein
MESPERQCTKYAPLCFVLAVDEERTCLEAAECIRELIEEIRLVPDNGTLRIEPYGQLAALITLANGHPRSRGTGCK